MIGLPIRNVSFNLGDFHIEVKDLDGSFTLTITHKVEGYRVQFNVSDLGPVQGVGNVISGP